jgi:hypothetical protein
VFFLKFFKKFLTYEMFVHNIHSFPYIFSAQLQLSNGRASPGSKQQGFPVHFCDHNILGVTEITIT